MRDGSSRVFVVLLAALAFMLLVVPTANAYIDPGSGSYVFQLLVGAALGAGVAVKVFWRRIVNLFSRRSRESDKSASSEDSSELV